MVLQKPGNVTIDVTVSIDGVVALSAVSVTFTSGNWNQPQTITLQGLADGVYTGNRSVEVTLSVNDALTDAAYDAVPDVVFPVHVIDMDPIPNIDLIATAFAVADHTAADGSTSVTFTVANPGTAASGSFQTQIVWSPNDIIGDGDDVLLPETLQTFTGLNAGTDESRTVTAVIGRSALFSQALLANPAGQPVGTVSQLPGHLFLIVDSTNAVIEIDETNNSGTGPLIDSDIVSYFPWDTNGNGTIEPLEALAAIQAIGTAAALQDYDGNGIVTPLEALSAIQRIGYGRMLMAPAPPSTIASTFPDTVEPQQAVAGPVSVAAILSSRPAAESNEALIAESREAPSAVVGSAWASVSPLGQVPNLFPEAKDEPQEKGLPIRDELSNAIEVDRIYEHFDWLTLF
ncbi:MAG: CARDB domain-containing protein [Planctomycetaceae bacterium]